MLLDAFINFCGQLFGALGVFFILIADAEHLGHFLEDHHGEHIGGHQIAVGAGVIAGTEAGPGHAGGGDGIALAFVMQGIAIAAILEAGEAIGGIVVILFHGPGVHDADHGVPEFFGEQIIGLGDFIILPGQAHGIAKGIHFIFALPYPGAHFGDVIHMALAVGFEIEGVGIGIHEDGMHLAGDHLAHHIPDFFRFHHQGQIILYLGAAVPQPHGGDIAGDHEGVVFGNLDGGGPGIDEGIAEKLLQGFVIGFRQQIFHVLLHDLGYFIHGDSLLFYQQGINYL